MATTTEVPTAGHVEALTRRVEALEKRILSQDGTLPVISLTTAVRELERKLEALATRENSRGAQQVWSKLDRLERLVSPEYVESLKMTEEARADILCGQVEQLSKFSDRMEEVHQLKDYINSTECQGLETHERKLAIVAATHLEQEATVTQLTRQTQALMEGYRKIMLQLSAQCVEWNETLQQREAVKTS